MHLMEQRKVPLIRLVVALLMSLIAIALLSPSTIGGRASAASAVPAPELAPFTVTGTLTIGHMDYPDGHSEPFYRITSPEGTYRIVLPNEPSSTVTSTSGEIAQRLARAPPNLFASFSGYQIGSHAMVVTDISIPRVPPPPIEQPPKPARIDARVLVILNHPASWPQPGITPERARELWFTNPANHEFYPSVRSFFEESSLGEFTMYGDVAGWYVLPDPPSGIMNCGIEDNEWHVRQYADAAARNDGFEPDDYDLIFYVCGSEAGPGSSGGHAETIPGRRAYIDSNHRSIASHELSHLLGMYHSGQLYCPEGRPEHGWCNGGRSQPTYDVMGGNPLVHHLASHKDIVNWLPPSTIIDVETSGMYRLDGPLEARGYDVKVLRIPRPTGGTYYLSMRRPIGFDAWLDRFGGTNLVIEELLDGISWGRYYRDAVVLCPLPSPFYCRAWDDGEQFCDVANRIRIMQLHHDAGRAYISVELNADCAAPPPCGGFGQRCCTVMDYCPDGLSDSCHMGTECAFPYQCGGDPFTDQLRCGCGAMQQFNMNTGVCEEISIGPPPFLVSGE